MSEKLLSCPFCGGEAKTSDTTTDEENKFKFGWIGCQKCRVFINYINNQRGKQAAIAAWNRRAQPEITGETSDGYHTFNELYHHRAVLFSVICNDRPTQAWKSKLHHDGTMYDGMFIVGIETPDGQATYHYDIEPYWEMFNVQELPQAPEWDGHTPAQAIERIGKLRTQPENEPLTLEELREMDGEPVWCEYRGPVCVGKPWGVIGEWMLVNGGTLHGNKGIVVFGRIGVDANAYRSKPKEEV